MPQTFSLENKIVEFVADETESFVNRLSGYVGNSGSPYFDFSRYDVFEAIYSNPYPYPIYFEYELERAIDDSIRYLTSQSYMYVDDFYGPEPLDPFYDYIDTSAYGAFNGSINEEVITDLESEYLAEIGESYSIDVDYSANYISDGGGYEDFYISGLVNETDFLANLLLEANTTTGLNYVEANPDLDTILTTGTFNFQSNIHGYNTYGNTYLDVFLVDGNWDVFMADATVDYMGGYPGSGGYFDSSMFQMDLEREISMNLDMYMPYPIYDPMYQDIYMRLYDWGMTHPDPMVYEAFMMHPLEIMISDWIMNIDPVGFEMMYGFDPYIYIEFDMMAHELYQMFGGVLPPFPIFPGGDPFYPGPGGIDTYLIAENITNQLMRNNDEYFNPTINFLDPELVNEEFRVVEINVEDYLNSLESNVYIENPVNDPFFVEGFSDPIIQSELSPINSILPVKEVINTEAINLSYQFVDENGDVIENIVVLGDDTETTYTLQIIADTLVDGFELDSVDIEFSFNSGLFESISRSDISMSESFQEFSSFSSDSPGLIRFAGANISDLDGSANADTPNVLAELNLNFNESELSNLATNSDGSFVSSDLGFSLSANLNDTVLSKDIDNGLNKQILSVAQFGGDKFTTEGSTDVYLYEQKSGILETGDGFEIMTDRIIGADAAATNLVRAGDTLSATTSYLNIGNVKLDILEVKGINSGDSKVELVDYYLSKSSLEGGIFEGGSFISSSDITDLTADFSIVGAAGEVVDLSGVLDIQTSVGDTNFTNDLGTKNLITYQGDLNYDGRVSMKDLAYLNAGAARVNSGGDVAGDVDANFDNSIDILDLAVLDADWGKSLHSGSEDFLGSSDISWEELDSQGNMIWDNTVFKEQNAFEAYQGFVGSLESPTSSVIGADGNIDANDDDMLGTIYQDLA